MHLNGCWRLLLKPGQVEPSGGKGCCGSVAVVGSIVTVVGSIVTLEGWNVTVHRRRWWSRRRPIHRRWFCKMDKGCFFYDVICWGEYMCWANSLVIVLAHRRHCLRRLYNQGESKALLGRDRHVSHASFQFRHSLYRRRYSILAHLN